MISAALTAICTGILCPQALTDLSGGLSAAESSFTTEPKPIMVKSGDKLWLQCGIDAAAGGANRLAGFCAHLAAEITRLTGREVLSGAAAPMGARVLGVHVEAIDGNRARVVLTVFEQKQGGAQLIMKQDLRIGRKDAQLGNSSATALVPPLMAMLGNDG